MLDIINLTIVSLPNPLSISYKRRHIRLPYVVGLIGMICEQNV